eukprot:TRINITY_DN28597_c1_g2_i1.p1 TRINITY_DN28597_c1_g2~~TRINITY_DN28597_c1_g2_i1.p1  ORF type:complete len:110 (-),score=7.03 TRINITY_DN28597_c1_g2_i1:18-347(-)
MITHLLGCKKWQYKFRMSFHVKGYGFDALDHLFFNVQKKKGSPVHEAPATGGFGEGRMYAALPPQAERLFPCFESVMPRLQWNNLTIVPRPALKCAPNSSSELFIFFNY